MGGGRVRPVAAGSAPRPASPRSRAAPPASTPSSPATAGVRASGRPSTPPEQHQHAVPDHNQLIWSSGPGMAPSSRCLCRSDRRLVGRLRAAGCVFAEEEAVLLAEAAGRRTTWSGWSPSAARGAAGAGRRLGRVLRGADRRRARRCSCRGGGPSCWSGWRWRPCTRATWWSTSAAGPARSRRRCSPRVPGLEVCAADVDPAAVACARRNLPPERVSEGDLYDPLPDRPPRPGRRWSPQRAVRATDEIATDAARGPRPRGTGSRSTAGPTGSTCSAG